MANQKHREHFKQAMALIRSMSDESLLARIRSHGKGEYGQVFGLPEKQLSIQFSIPKSDLAEKHTYDSFHDSLYSSIDEYDYQSDAANDQQYDLAA